MTAPRAATGRYFIASVRATKTRVNTAAATRPATWVRPPTASLIAVRESAPLTGKPPNSPEAMFAAPKPINSRFFRTEAARGNDAAAEADNKDTKRVQRQIV